MSHPLRRSLAGFGIFATLLSVSAARAVAPIADCCPPAACTAAVSASKPQHLDPAVAALSLNLTPEEIAMLEAPYTPHPVVGFK